MCFPRSHTNCPRELATITRRFGSLPRPNTIWLERSTRTNMTNDWPSSLQRCPTSIHQVSRDKHRWTKHGPASHSVGLRFVVMAAVRCRPVFQSRNHHATLAAFDAIRVDTTMPVWYPIFFDRWSRADRVVETWAAFPFRRSCSAEWRVHARTIVVSVDRGF